MKNEHVFGIENIIEHESGNISTTISLDQHHPVFAGHFPGIPVLPGVIMMKIAKNCLETHLKRRLKLSSIDSMKFLNMVNPVVQPRIELQLSYATTPDGMFRVDAKLSWGETVFFKMTKAYYS